MSRLPWSAIWLLSLSASLVVTNAARATQIWDADNGVLEFTKPSSVDPTLPANQDAITSNVVITRGEIQGIYNAVLEIGYAMNESPADTEWAFSGLNANPTFLFGDGAENFATLSFTNWQDSVQGAPPAMVGIPAVVHLITDDIFIDIQFNSWDQRAGGGFSYLRASGIPEPNALALASIALATWGGLRRRR